MPHRAPRILTLVLATAGACLVATGATAQSTTGATPAPGRYLSWANRPANTTPADVTAAQTRARNAMIPRRVAPSQAPYQPVMQAPVTNITVSRGLTPASAWLGPRVAPTFASGSPEPLAYTEMAAAPPPTYAAPPAPVMAPPAQPRLQPTERIAADPMAPRRDAPVFNLQRPVQPAPQAPAVQAPVAQAPVVQAPAPRPVAAADTIDDPMAPRRDARIFQMQQGQTQGQQQAVLPTPAEVAPSTAAATPPGQSGARYYSVHRDAGHRPDPTALPEPVYFDSVALDLAEPPATEIQPRDAQGRRRAAVVPNEDPSLP